MWDEFWKVVLPSSALTVAVLAYLIKRFIEQQFAKDLLSLKATFDERLQKDLLPLRHELDVNLKSIESELSRSRNREQILQQTLQPRRAEKISEFALALSEYIDAVNRLIKIHPLDTEEQARKARIDTYEVVRSSLKKVWLVLPLTVARDVLKLVRDAFDYGTQAEIYRDHGGEVNSNVQEFNRKKSEEIWTKYRTDIFPRHEAIEELFRKMLGVEPFEDLPADPNKK